MKLIHYGDGKVFINGNQYDYGHLLKLVPEYSAPWRFPIRVYERGVQHFASDGSTTIPLPIIDAYCDGICMREDELIRLVKTLRR